MIIETYFDLLTCQGPGHRYHPKPSKSVLVVHPDNLEARKEFGELHEFKVYTGAYYIGGYIRDNESESDWLRERMLTWEKNISTIRKTAGKYPQESYGAVVRAIKSSWIFLQHATCDTGDAFVGVEKMIWETFLPCIFLRKTKTLSLIVGDLSTILDKKYGLGLLIPVMSAKGKCLISWQGSA